MIFTKVLMVSKQSHATEGLSLASDTHHIFVNVTKTVMSTVSAYIFASRVNSNIL